MFGSSYLNHLDMSSQLGSWYDTRFKVFASFNILQYLCDFIHVLIFVSVSKCRKSPKLTNIVILATISSPQPPLVRWPAQQSRLGSNMSRHMVQPGRKCFSFMATHRWCPLSDLWKNAKDEVTSWWATYCWICGALLLHPVRPLLISTSLATSRSRCRNSICG